MPIAAAQSLLKAQIGMALKMGKAAQVTTTAQVIASAIGSSVPMGFFPTAPVPVPLYPAGLSAGQALISSALNMGPAATIATTAQMMAMGISVIAPTAPPAGLSALQSQIESALSSGKGADQSIIAEQLATAIVQYYQSGGVQ